MIVNPPCLFRSSVHKFDGHELECLQFPKLEVSSPQVFSALTMLFPALHGYYMAPDIAADASFPQGNRWTSMKIVLSCFAAMTCWGLTWFSPHSRCMGFAICNSFSLSGQHGLPPSQCCFQWASWHGKTTTYPHYFPCCNFGYLSFSDICCAKTC